MALNIQEIIQNIMEVQRRKPPLPGSVNKCLMGKCPLLGTFFKVFSNLQRSQVRMVFFFFFFTYRDMKYFWVRALFCGPLRGVSNPALSGLNMSIHRIRREWKTHE